MSQAAELTTLRVDTWNDIVCPWCYVGEARLVTAVSALAGDVEIEVVPHAFELDPHHSHPEPVIEMLSRKYGASTEQAQSMDERVATMARAEGLPYDSNRVTANTFDAHRLVAAARAVGLGLPMLHALQRGHFSGQLDLESADALAAVAERVGLGEARAREVLSGDEFADEVRADQATARRIGVTGVPFTVVGEQLAIPGCAETTQYSQVIRQVLAD